MVRYIFGIDLGATYGKIGLVNWKNKILVKNKFATKDYLNKKDLIEAIVKIIKDILKQKKLCKKDILGIGMGLPGPIDSKNGIVHFFPNIAGWHNVPLKKIIQNKLGIPKFIDNDVNLMALAESRIGAGRGVKNIVCLTLGTGVGGGLILEGQLYRGWTLSAGEIGHVPLNENGPLCKCGGKACLERYIGNKYILQKAREKFGKNITLETLSEKAKKGNFKAIKIWQDVGRRLGLALSGIINLLDPQIIIIGGGISAAGSVLFDSVRKTIQNRMMSEPLKDVKVVKTRLGQNASIIGATFLVREKTRVA